MATTAAVIAATSALLKKIIDDVYVAAKDKATNSLGKVRSDVREQPIARALHGITKVKTLWNIEKEVSLYEYYYPSSIQFSADVRKRIDCISGFGNIQNFVIQGTAGQGKSIFLRYLCGQELMPQVGSGRVPILAELRRIRSDLDLNALIEQSLEKYKLPHTASAWNFLASTGKFVLLLDAFDEIEASLVDRTIAQIEQLSDIHADKLQILVTSRPDADIQHSSRFRVCRLAPLERSDQLPFLKKICSDTSQANSLHKVVQGSPADVSELLTTPLMLTLLVILYMSLQTVPDTVPKFYEELFDVLFYRHDHSKPGFRRKRYTQLDDSTVKRLFSAFCFYVRSSGFSVLTTAQMIDCCNRASAACNQQVDPLLFKQELVKTVCLMQEEGFEISFIHKSVTQYYAASFVCNSSDKFAEKFYRLVSKATGWNLELKFLSKIDEYRYMKFFELPLLERVGSVLKIEFGNHVVGNEGEKISDYLLEHCQVVSNAQKSKEIGVMSFVGWINNPGPNDIAAEIAYPWIGDILHELNNRRIPIVAEEPNTGSHHQMKVARFSSYVLEPSRKSSQKIFDNLLRRYFYALTIIKVEQEKIDALGKLGLADMF